MYFVFKRTSPRGYRVHYGVIKETDPNRAYARFAALAPDLVTILRETEIWSEAAAVRNAHRNVQKGIQ